MLNFMLSLKLQLLESVDDAVRIPVLFSEQRKEVWKCGLAACSLEAKVATNPEFLVCFCGPGSYLSSRYRL